ncbi:Rho GTPase activation protein [Sporodiniella umbellata]|nr:Rho GTPase activation protein [Sporodiniella umbellata]
MNSTQPIQLSASQKKIARTWWKKTNANNPELKQRRMSVLGVFGIPLTESISYACSRITFVDASTGIEHEASIPLVIAKCGLFLKERALHEEGVFRISGNAKRLTALQALFDKDPYGLEVDWTGYTVHDAANLMTRYLNHLPQPLITAEYQHSFKNIIDLDFPSLDSKILAFGKLITRLPIVHQHLLLYILDLLYLFSLHSHTTRMDLSSLSTAFAPVIFPDPNDHLNPAGYKKSQRILELLIQYQEQFEMPLWLTTGK